MLVALWKGQNLKQKIYFGNMIIILENNKFYLGIIEFQCIVNSILRKLMKKIKCLTLNVLRNELGSLEINFFYRDLFIRW